MDILDRILETKREELRFDKRRSLKQALLSSPTGIIAEFKRKSPSKGWIHEDARPEEVVPAYAAAGAAALSVLTDETYFGGSLEFIRRVRPLVDIPILRKDFIIDPVQLVEARQAGADAALLAEAHRLGLEVLLEIHSEEELDYITPEVDVVGVNNRHLGSFVTDVQTSFDLAPLLTQLPLSRADRNYFSDRFAEKPISAPPSTTPAHATRPVFISESGISRPETVRELRAAGYRGFLMGETFMKNPDPGAALADFIQAL